MNGIYAQRVHTKPYTRPRKKEALAFSWGTSLAWNVALNGARFALKKMRNVPRVPLQ